MDQKQHEIVDISDYIEDNDQRQVADEVFSEEYSDELTDSTETELEESIPDVQEPLPQPVVNHKNKLFLSAAAFFVGAIAVSIYMKSFYPLVLLLGAAYFAYNGFSVVRRYRSGMIREVAVICTNAKASTLHDRMTVTFKTLLDDESEEKEEYFRFTNLPRKKVDDFALDYPYLIYFDVDNPQALIAYIDL